MTIKLTKCARHLRQNMTDTEITYGDTCVINKFKAWDLDGNLSFHLISLILHVHKREWILSVMVVSTSRIITMIGKETPIFSL